MHNIMIRIFAVIALIFSLVLSTVGYAADFSPMLSIVPASTSTLDVYESGAATALNYTVTNNSTEPAYLLTINPGLGMNASLVTAGVTNDTCSGQALPLFGSQCTFSATVAGKGTLGATTLAPQVCKSSGALCSIPVLANRVPVAIHTGSTSISVISGSAQTAVVGTQFTNPLVVKVVDGSNAPVVGATVTFTVPSSGASGTFAGGVNTAITNSSGEATSPLLTANTVAGAYTVTAIAPGALTSASFSLTNTASGVTHLVVSSGSPQSAAVGTAFQPLVAEARDVYNNPVSGVVVTFTAPGSGASATLGTNPVTTDSSGLASISATANTAAGGPYNVAASAPSATSVNFALTNTGVPTVTGISPTAGPTAGGTSVVITGTNFTGATAVKFASTDATTYTVNSATQITATSPAGSAGVVDVTVTTGGGTSATGSADQFTYTAAPTVTGISPTTGPIAGGTSVVITGTNFTGATAVKFASTDATTYTVNSATQITATSPAGSAGIVNVTVTTAGGTSATSSADQFTYTAVPTVTGISPTAGPTAGGTSVVITGTNFTGATAVKFAATDATTYTVNSATQITATSPAGSAGAVDVTVTTLGGTSATGSADQFTYTAAPTVTGISPTAGPTAGGTSVTVTGTNFTGATAVSFGAGVGTSVVVDSATQITVTSPAGSAGIVNVTVTTAGGTSATSSADQFTYFALPTVTSISPSSGLTPGGTSVTVTGTNFTGATGVSFGASAGTSLVVVSATQLTITSPSGSVGTVDVTVTTPGGTSATSSADQFTYSQGYTVTPSAGTGGTISPSTPQAVASGASITFTATPTADPDAGVVGAWTVNGVAFPSCGSSSTCTLTGIFTDQSIHVDFNPVLTVTEPSLMIVNRSFSAAAAVDGPDQDYYGVLTINNTTPIAVSGLSVTTSVGSPNSITTVPLSDNLLTTCGTSLAPNTSCVQEFKTVMPIDSTTIVSISGSNVATITVPTSAISVVPLAIPTDTTVGMTLVQGCTDTVNDGGLLQITNNALTTFTVPVNVAVSGGLTGATVTSTATSPTSTDVYCGNLSNRGASLAYGQYCLVRITPNSALAGNTGNIIVTTPQTGVNTEITAKVVLPNATEPSVPGTEYPFVWDASCNLMEATTQDIEPADMPQGFVNLAAICDDRGVTTPGSVLVPPYHIVDIGPSPAATSAAYGEFLAINNASLPSPWALTANTYFSSNIVSENSWSYSGASSSTFQVQWNDPTAYGRCVHATVSDPS
ncbi:MAG: IPT/TIG domain-containing protein [Coxiellaceae bacterium]|nr:IPT/TIG domain-containing protein [Coxiellaceae bacterium]